MIIGIKRLLNTFFILTLSNIPLLAQSNLMKQVDMGEQKQEQIAHLLEKIANKQNFSFAYNNKVIPADSMVNVSGYRGTLFGLLEQLLGEKYEFKEIPGYVVLRYAPGKLLVSAEAFKDAGSQTTLKGYVRGISDQQAIVRASVYEKNLLLSTLTDDQGYFELKLKSYAGPVTLMVSKENYRDTSLNMLPDVVVQEKKPSKKYKYYPDNANGADVEHSRFARLFITSKQFFQGLNVGNFFASSPYQVSLFPGLSTQGLFNSQVVDHFSVNLIGGYTAGVDGVEFAGLFNLNRKDMRYVQIASIFNFVGGNAGGVQLAGLYNRVLNRVSGFQFAGLANNTGKFTGGFQLAILANKSGQFAGGLQLATLVNMNQHAAGVQAAGLTNTAVSSKGVAIAGLTNIARDSSGVQIAGLLNKSRNVSLLQVGFTNIAKKVHGIQVGFMNIADSTDYPMGIINLVKHGEKSISLSTDESFFTHADFRSGGKVLYGLIGVGFQEGLQKMHYAVNAGIGAHVINHTVFSLNTEYVTAFFRDNGDQQYQTMSFKLLPVYKLNKHWALFAGPAIKLASGNEEYGLNNNGLILSRSFANDHTNTLSVGITGGLMYRWY